MAVVIPARQLNPSILDKSRKYLRKRVLKATDEQLSPFQPPPERAIAKFCRRFRERLLVRRRRRADAILRELAARAKRGPGGLSCRCENLMGVREVVPIAERAHEVSGREEH